VIFKDMEKKHKKDIAIVCEVMRGELEKLTADGSSDMDFIFVQQHLHDTPDKMRARLQEEIDKVGDGYQRIILVYGLCSNGVAGLKSDDHEIIIPRIDDCISLFLGSRERYVEEFKKDPATYYLCRGWIEHGGDPYRLYLKWTGRDDRIPEGWFSTGKTYDRSFDEETARMLVHELLKNYRRIILIDNDDLEKAHRDYARDMAAFMREIIGREIELVDIKGSSRLLEKVLGEKWDGSEIIRVKPGQEILQEYFFRQ